MTDYSTVFRAMITRVVEVEAGSRRVELIKREDGIHIEVCEFQPKEKGKGNKRVIIEDFLLDEQNAQLLPLPLKGKVDRDYTILRYFEDLECHKISKEDVMKALSLTEGEFRKRWEDYQLNPNFLITDNQRMPVHSTFRGAKGRMTSHEFKNRNKKRGGRKRQIVTRKDFKEIWTKNPKFKPAWLK